MSEIRITPKTENALYAEFDTNEVDQERIWQALGHRKKEIETRLGVLKPIIELQLGRKMQEGDLKDFIEFIEQNRSAYISDRNYSDVASDHTMSNYQLANYIENKTVLDLGSGHSTFAEDVGRKKYKSKIILADLSPEALKTAAGSDLKAVADSKNLPFKSNSFDTILATNSIPLWNNSPDEVSTGTEELLRVVKEGGYILISPVVGFATRPPLAKDGSKIGTEIEMGGFKARRDPDPRVHYVLNLNELAFIEALQKIKNNHTGEITFTKKDSVVQSLIIKKLVNENRG